MPTVIHLNVSLRPDQIERLRDLAAADDRSISALLRRILDQHLPTTETK